MTTIKVPTSNATLAALFQAHHEMEWSIAATIYAWTTTDNLEVDRSIVVAFANRKLPGMSNPAKVYAYREAYETAIADGVAAIVTKGDTIKIPTINFSEYFESTAWRLKARQKAQSKAKSQQQESLERDGHKPGGSKRHAPGTPRVATPKENIERALQEVEVALKKIGVGVQRQQVEFARLQLQSALSTFLKATAA